MADLETNGLSIAGKPHDADLRVISTEERQARGVVYTPQHLVRFVLDRAGYTPQAPVESMKLIDPSCGNGAFLSEAFARLACRAGVPNAPKKSTTAKRFERVLRENLFGVDVDPEACALAREALREQFELVTGYAPSPSFLESNIVASDFLDCDATRSQLEPSSFDLIVGNPPYVPTTRLDSETKRRFRSHFSSARGRIDLYMLFMERAIDLLADGGKFAYVTPNKFLTSVSGRALRSLIVERGALVSVSNFKSHKVFREAATVPCVTVFMKGGNADNFTVEECTHRETPTPSISVRRSGRSGKLSAPEWHTEPSQYLKLSARLRNQGTPLERYAERISAGPATGRDSIFVIPDSEIGEIEEELTHPAVRGRDIYRFRIDDPKLRILVPYRFEQSGSARLVDIEEFPAANRYLSKHKATLKRRHCVRTWGKTWYDLHDPISFDLASRTKILVPDVAGTNRFALDRHKVVPLHSAYYIIPVGLDPAYLVAVLNSLPIEFLARLHAPVVKDGFSRYRRQFLRSLPIPQATHSDQRQVALAADAGDFDYVDSFVARTLGARPKDLDVMKRFLRERAS